MIVLYIVLGVVGGVALAALFVWFNNGCLTVTRRSLKLEGVKEGFKIIHLSDLHKKRFGRRNGALIAKIERERPDVIVFTGDIVHRYTPKDIEVALELVNALSKIAPVLFSAGNHEMRNKGYRFFKKQLAEAGATVLDNRCIEIDGVVFAGLNCASSKNGTVFKLKEQAGSGKPTVLLAHMPHFASVYSEAGFDITLCGHAHGGQWRIPFTRRGLYAPGQGAFPEYTEGVHRLKGTTMLISRGLGNSEFPLRLFNRPEIVVIEFD